MNTRATLGLLTLCTLVTSPILTAAMAAERDTDRVLLLINQALYNATHTNLQRYETEVEARFPVDLHIQVGTFTAQTPEQIRAHIQDEYYSPAGLDGVILCGQMPYAVWRQDPEFGTNQGPLAFFYEDLDGAFYDLDSDGRYDYHTWGTADGPEIWTCWMRPPVMNEAAYLNALLNEAHAYYVGDFVTQKQGYVACHGDYDGNFWDGAIPSMPALVEIYGSGQVGTDGEGSDPVVASQLAAQLFSHSYDIVHFWSHASNSLQAWDSGAIWSTTPMGAAAGTGPLIAHIYGCHSGDFIGYEGTSASNTNIAIAYAFGPGAGQAASGTSWSYGTEGMNLITDRMGGGWYLGAAWKYLLDVRENSTLIHQHYPDRDIHKELSGNNLFGNPFLYANWTGSTVTDPYPPVLSAAMAGGDPQRVAVLFSEPLEQTSAEDVANYALDQGIVVLNAALEPDERTVFLSTTPMAPETTYTLTVNDVYDQADPPNPIAPDSTITFVYRAWDRVTLGLVALYDFEEAAGAVVHDVSGIGTPLDLTIQDPPRVTWTTGGLRIDAATRVNSAIATKLIAACQTSDELTIEAWIVPSVAAQSGPARIVTLSPHANSRNFTLAQGAADGSSATCYDVRLRTTATSDNGLPSLTTPTGVAATALQHVVYTRSVDGDVTVYVDGAPAAAGVVGGDLSNWAVNYRLSLANEYNYGQPWYGEYRTVAVYARALTPDEVLQNYAAGADAPPVVCAGDMNCDSVVDYADIDLFVAALGCPGGSGWPHTCPWLSADCDADDDVTYADIDAFVGRIGAACP